jgi:hypothetical protein
MTPAPQGCGFPSFIVEVDQVLGPSCLIPGAHATLRRTHRARTGRRRIRRVRGRARVLDGTCRGVRPGLIEIAGLFQELRILEHAPVTVLNARRVAQLLRSHFEHNGLGVVRCINAHVQCMVRNHEDRMARPGYNGTRLYCRKSRAYHGCASARWKQSCHL